MMRHLCDDCLPVVAPDFVSADDNSKDISWGRACDGSVCTSITGFCSETL